jgi:phosphatidylserine/phosphatidylglycerophosphate/cardiolipin synthase-like enzyme
VRNRGLLGIVVAVVSTVLLTGGTVATPASAVQSRAVAAAEPAKPASSPMKFTPGGGPTFNNPYGTDSDRRAIIRKLLRTIDSVPKGGEIRIASWNVRSNNITAALVRAHRRHVSVQVVMDYSNANPQNPNVDVQHLRQGLRPGNKKREPDRRSWVRECHGACRGPHGIAHTKFYLFSQAGKAHDIVIYGSNNATELAATIQWNDIYTVVDQPDMYGDFEGVFREMSRDRRPKAGGYREFVYPQLTSIFYPNYGKDAPVVDPDLKRLRQIRCTGTTGGVGVNGHTKIRIAQTAMHGDRGIRLAERLATMQRRGCDIRVVYAMFGGDVVRILRQAGIGLTHLAWDSNDDGLYDRYVHMKAMAVAGVIGKKTNAFMTVNGSANWTSVAQVSDEIVGVFDRAATTRKYINWIDYLYHHRPASWGSDAGGGVSEGRAFERRARARGIDPYALIKKDL